MSQKIQQKIDFCNKYSELLKGKKREYITNPDVKRIAQLMREEIGFSPKTNDIDIYCSIIAFNERILLK